MMFNLKANIQIYDYRIRQIKVEKNFIADILSRRPLWLTDGAQAPEYSGDPEEDFTVDNVEEEDQALRVLISEQHILKNNSALKGIEVVGLKDPNYTQIIEHIRTNKSFKHLHESSEGGE